MIQTILGAGGVIGKELARVLPAYTDQVRLVSRHPEKINPGDTLYQADLADPEQVDKAVAGSSVCYLTAGLPYQLSIWQELWPRIMRNTIDACKKHGAVLIFFDNIYCYGKVSGPITETCPIKPDSKKGDVRASLVRMLQEAWGGGGLSGAIVRSADFYGKGANNSMMTVLVQDKLKLGKKPQWLCSDRVRYSMTYTPDAAMGTALVGNTREAMNQVWHLPSSHEETTSGQLIGLTAELLNGPSGRTILSKGMLRLAGLFDKTVAELVEMTYQYQNDYIFDSTKFENHFKYRPASYREGLTATLLEK